MRFSLINPPWTFEGSIYFGCRHPHLPLEFGYAKALLEKEGHEAEIIDAQLEGLSIEETAKRVKAFGPDFTVVTTAPSYLFWRCAPPELKVPIQVVEAVQDVGGYLVGVGPHGSTTPRTALAKLGVDAVVVGEFEEVLPRLGEDWGKLDSVCSFRDGHVHVNGGPHASNMSELPALEWDEETISRHAHHHHRFDEHAEEPGAEMEASRGCPYHCTFCAKDNFRNDFRKRPLAVIATELDALIRAGAKYVYFIDEIFLPNRPLLELMQSRPIQFGIQTRIDLWRKEMLQMLGKAGCVSIEAGVESISGAGRDLLNKNCKISTEEITERLVYAKTQVAFVQANLLDSMEDDPAEVKVWREHLQAHGVWSNVPVPMFSYPGSPDYTMRWGVPDDKAWERAHEDYLRRFHQFSDIQDERPLALVQLEDWRGANG